MTPFMKYAGGKRKLAPAVLARLPDPREIRLYVEPFVGGGAVFLALREAGYTGPAVLNDASPIIVAVWQAVQLDPEGVLRAFNTFADRHSQEMYYAIRAAPPVPVAVWLELAQSVDQNSARRGDCAALAGWFLYLNKAGFNGLWRVNRAGLPNVPIGDYKHPPRLDEAAVRAAHEALRGVTVTCGDFAAVLLPERSTLDGRLDRCSVYCDPPYLPTSSTASFTAYTQGGFGARDQLRLAHWCRGVADQGARVVLSNAGIGDSRTAFARLADREEQVEMARAINSKGSARGKVPEYLFTYSCSPRWGRMETA